MVSRAMTGSTGALLAASTLLLASFIGPTLAASNANSGGLRTASKHSKRAVPDLSLDTVSTTEASDLTSRSYDYVVVGGGTAGLAVAARLAEANNTVAVIEAGSSGDAVMDRILPPAIAYINGIAYPGSPYDWQYYTSNQTDLGNRPVYWPRGKLLGGSSAVNGVYMTRASAVEHDVWSQLSNSSLWTWEIMNEYYKKHESFSAPTQSFSNRAGGVEVDADAHGYDGPIHYSRGGYLYEQIGEWIPTFASLGVPTGDPASGNTTGAYLSTGAIKTDDQTRSYARPGYTPRMRNNLDILTGYQATRINFDQSNGSTAATGVSFQSSRDSQTYTIQANNEVILSAGVIGSPHILQLSGVGPADLLNQVGIDVVHDLPGVGAHLQDHLSTSVTFTSNAAVTGDLLYTNSTFNSTHWDLWTSGQGNSSVYSAPNNAIAYLNITTLMGEAGARSFISNVTSQLDAYVEQEGLSGTVEAGYRALYLSEIEAFLEGGEGAVEFLMANTGYASGEPGRTTTLQFATQRPFSRGAVRLTSSDPFTIPSINPGYLTHPSDIAIIREAMKYIRNVASTAPLSSVLGSEIAPGTSSVSSDADIESFVRRQLSTEYHPAGSCSMLPLAYGGCVDDEARVYGISNLRVIDSSIIPVSTAAHLCSPTYALAERAVDLILGNLPPDSAAASNRTATSGGPSGNVTSGIGSNANTSPSGTEAQGAATQATAVPTAMTLCMFFLSFTLV